VKKCSTCKDRKPLTEFGKNKNKPDGFQTQCKQCKKKSQDAWYEKHKDRHIQNVNKRNKRVAKELRVLINQIKDVPCADCGLKFHPFLMDFDHVGGDKVGEISIMVANKIALSTILEEIAKCEVVCCLCHRTRTWNRANPDNQISNPYHSIKETMNML
jgi:hypothetical protein